LRVPFSRVAQELIDRGRTDGEFGGHVGNSSFACSNLGLGASSLFLPTVVDSTHFRSRLLRMQRAHGGSHATDEGPSRPLALAPKEK